MYLGDPGRDGRDGLPGTKGDRGEPGECFYQIIPNKNVFYKQTCKLQEHPVAWVHVA